MVWWHIYLITTSYNFILNICNGVFRGGLAQMGERLICIQEVNGSIPLSSTNIMLRLLNKYEAAQFVSTRHYSAVMPRLTKYYFGYYIKDIGVNINHL